MVVNRREQLHTRNFLTNLENSNFLRNAQLRGVCREEENKVSSTAYFVKLIIYLKLRIQAVCLQFYH
jgi:hypothetical protein